MPNKLKMYWKLFSSTFMISVFTFGGGFVIIPLLRKKFVEELGWLEEDEMMDMAAIAQSSPGPIAVNASILIGHRVAGIPGALCTILGTVLPPLVIISVISLFYQLIRDNPVVAALLQGMRAAVAAVIVDVTLTLGKNVWKNQRWFGLALMVAAFIAGRFLSVNAAFVVLGAALVGGLRASLALHGKGAKA